MGRKVRLDLPRAPLLLRATKQIFGDRRKKRMASRMKSELKAMLENVD